MIKLVVPLVTSGALVHHSGTDIPEEFRSSMSRLMDHVRRSADDIMPGGTTGEGHLLTMDQYSILLQIVAEFRGSLGVRAGVLGRDDQVGTQVQIARENRIHDIVLGLNHTGDHEVRVAAALEAMGPKGRLFLYNMPGGFSPLEIEFVARCFGEDPRVVGVKDSSGDAAYFEKLIALKGNFPGRIVSHGSEPLYGSMSADRRKLVDEVTAGTGNAYPKLLRYFLDNPAEFGAERTRLGNMIGEGRGGFDSRFPGGKIGDYIYGLKTSLRLQGILNGPEDFLMYGDKGKGFFPKD